MADFGKRAVEVQDLHSLDRTRPFRLLYAKGDICAACFVVAFDLVAVESGNPALSLRQRKTVDSIVSRRTRMVLRQIPGYRRN